MKNELVQSKANLLLDPTVWNLVREQANTLVKSGFLPTSINTPEKAVAIMTKGVELGIPPMQAFSHIYIISGKPGISAELMLSLILRAIPNLPINYKRRDDQACVIVVTRPGSKPEEFSFTIEDAKRAGLMSNSTWQKYPRAMLRSRCISEMARSLFPDLLMGCSYTPEELGASVNEEGEVIEVKAESPKKIEEDRPTQEQLAHLDEMIRSRKDFELVFKNFKEGMKKKYGVDEASLLSKKQFNDAAAWISSLPSKDMVEDSDGAQS